MADSVDGSSRSVNLTPRTIHAIRQHCVSEPEHQELIRHVETLRAELESLKAVAGSAPPAQSMIEDDDTETVCSVAPSIPEPVLLGLHCSLQDRTSCATLEARQSSHASAHHKNYVGPETAFELRSQLDTEICSLRDKLKGSEICNEFDKALERLEVEALRQELSLVTALRDSLKVRWPAFSDRAAGFSATQIRHDVGNHQINDRQRMSDDAQMNWCMEQDERVRRLIQQLHMNPSNADSNDVRVNDFRERKLPNLPEIPHQGEGQRQHREAQVQALKRQQASQQARQIHVPISNTGSRCEPSPDCLLPPSSFMPSLHVPPNPPAPEALPPWRPPQPSPSGAELVHGDSGKQTPVDNDDKQVTVASVPSFSISTPVKAIMHEDPVLPASSPDHKIPLPPPSHFGVAPKLTMASAPDVSVGTPQKEMAIAADVSDGGAPNHSVASAPNVSAGAGHDETRQQESSRNIANPTFTPHNANRYSADRTPRTESQFTLGSWMSGLTLSIDKGEIAKDAFCGLTPRSLPAEEVDDPDGMSWSWPSDAEDADESGDFEHAQMHPLNAQEGSTFATLHAEDNLPTQNLKVQDQHITSIDQQGCLPTEGDVSRIDQEAHAGSIVAYGDRESSISLCSSDWTLEY
jgi:hypothetical protein